MRHYSLRDLLIATAAIGAGVVVGKYVGLVFGSYYALLIVVGYASSFVSLRVRWWLSAFTAAVAISPILGASGYAFSVPGSGVLLPQLKFGPFETCARAFYLCGAVPLNLAGNLLGGAFDEAIFFPQSSSVQPFIVLIVYAGVAVTLATSSLVATILAIRQRRRRIVAPSTDSSGVHAL